MPRTYETRITCDDCGQAYEVVREHADHVVNPHETDGDEEPCPRCLDGMALCAICEEEEGTVAVIWDTEPVQVCAACFTYETEEATTCAFEHSR